MIQRLRTDFLLGVRGRFHAHRAPCRDHHHRHPARNCDPVVPQLPRRAERSAAQANVRASIPGVEAYYADHTATGYSGLTSAVPATRPTTPASRT